MVATIALLGWLLLLARLAVFPGVFGLVASEGTGESAENAVVGLSTEETTTNTAGEGAFPAAVAFKAVGVVGVYVLVCLAVLMSLSSLSGARGPCFLVSGIGFVVAVVEASRLRRALLAVTLLRAALRVALLAVTLLRLASILRLAAVALLRLTSITLLLSSVTLLAITLALGRVPALVVSVS